MIATQSQQVRPLRNAGQLELSSLLEGSVSKAPGLTRAEVRERGRQSREFAEAQEDAKQFFRRKDDRRLTDLQVVILMALAKEHLFTLTDLAAELRRAINTVSAACTGLEADGYLQKYWKAEQYNKAPYSLVYVHLSPAGTELLQWLLGKS